MEKNNQTLEKGAYTGSSKNSLDASAERNKRIFIDEQQNIFQKYLGSSLPRIGVAGAI